MALAGPATWRDRAEPVHCTVALVLSWLLIAAGVLFPLTVETRIVLLVAGVALLGIPHGALDHLVAREWMRPRFGSKWKAAFLGAYLGLALLVLLLWILSPGVALIVFLAVAVSHFGLEDAAASGHRARMRIAEALSRGLIVVAFPLFFHPQQTLGYFTALTGGRSEWMVPVLTALAIPLGVAAAAGALFFCVWHIVRNPRTGGPVAAEILTVACLFVFLPPLLAFTGYFCFWHSPRHSLDLAAWCDESSAARGIRSFARRALPLTALTLLLAAGFYAVLRGLNLPVGEALLSTVFIGLSALTIPHVLMTEADEYRQLLPLPRSAGSEHPHAAS